jgi:hypothetical protein|nr:MAG TPA: hypothetical protein [Caudoviricetes sp.]
MVIRMTKEHKDILLSQSESRTVFEWENFFNNTYTRKQIYDFCYYHNKKIKKTTTEEFSILQSERARKYSINKDYFKIWSHNMAYVLGLWFADGCIYRNTHFDITLHKRDEYLLNLILKEFQYEGKIGSYKGREALRLSFSCREIYNDIVSLGGTERKSLSVSFPNIPKEFLNDFIRGYFDGDGCIYNDGKGRINASFTCGSKKFLIELLNILKQETKIQGGYYDDSSYTLRFGKQDSLILGNYLYKDNPELFLYRKRNKFIQ